MMIKPVLILILTFYLPTLNANENTTWTMSQVSNNNHYNINLKCSHPPTLSGFQECYIILTDKVKTLENVNIIIEGGMPKHHHGLPTAPTITWNSYKKHHDIKGLKFSMPGSWQLKFLIDKTEKLPRDIAIINFEID